MIHMTLLKKKRLLYLISGSLLVIGLFLFIFILQQRQNVRSNAAESSTAFSLTVLLHGIGNGGDTLNPSGKGNLSPQRKSREFTLEVFDSDNNLLLTKKAILNFDPAAGAFKGNVDWGMTLAAGSYQVKIKTPQYLRRQFPGFQKITSGQPGIFPQVSLVVGDVNNDNIINISDYTILMGCYSDFAPAKECTSTNKQLADFTDDGQVNAIDYNLFIREMSSRQGSDVTPSVTPTNTPASPITTGCNNTPNVVGGKDPWGGCWPGANNTGVPAGTQLTAYTGSCDIKTKTVIDSKIINCEINVSADVIIRKSKIKGFAKVTGQTGSLLIEDTEIDGGSEHSEATGYRNLTLRRVNVYGNQHTVHCDFNCTVEDSWMHDQYDGSSQGWHQNGFITNGGSKFVLRHNTAHCRGGCTADITLIPDDDVTDMLIDRNLFIATTDAPYCIYPSSNHPGKPGTVTKIVVTDNIFQRGSNKKCGYYGAVYGWDTPSNTPGKDGYGNVWTNNKWDDGTTLNP
jgi:hypothetical protein